MRGVLVIALLLIAVACAPAAQRESGFYCITTLHFADEAARAQFIEQDARRLVRRSDVTLLGSHPDAPQLFALSALSSEHDACPAAASHRLARLAGREARATFRATSHRAFMLEMHTLVKDQPAWDKDDVRRCVGRTPARMNDSDWVFMRGINTALRDPYVGSNGENIHFSANEDCATVRAIARAALAEAGRDPSDLSLCANASHRACGDPTDFSVGPALSRAELENLLNSSEH